MKKNIKKTILVVDDVIENIALITGILHEEYSIIPANGVMQMLKRIEKEKPDLILSDIMMPGIDGFEGIQRLYENKEMRDIPVIFMSAMQDTETEVKAFDLGAADFITKPICPPILHARIKRFMK